MTVVDLFAGPGGWDVAARELGLDTIGIEWDVNACDTRFAAGLTTLQKDVREVDPCRYKRGVSGLIASPPCQDFSSAGPKVGRGGERGRLIDVVPIWVEVCRPEWVVCEQVPGALPVWLEHVEFYRSLGYAARAGVLNAADFGVPQTRERAVLIASRHPMAGVRFPDPTHAEFPHPSLFGRQLKPWVTAAAAGVPGVIDRRQQHEGTPVPTVDGYTRPAPTVTGQAVGQWLVDGENLTVEQAAALQTFPPGYPWQGNKAQIGQQIGNAVPPLLARRILEVVL